MPKAGGDGNGGGGPDGDCGSNELRFHVVHASLWCHLWYQLGWLPVRGKGGSVVTSNAARNEASTAFRSARSCFVGR